MYTYENEYGVLTVEGYTVIPNQEMWDKYREYFSTCVKNPWGHFCDIHSDDPNSFPCIVETQWYENRDNYRYWHHRFTYKNNLVEKLNVIKYVERELKKQ